MKKNLQNLIIKNQYVLAKVITGKEVTFLVNPNFIFRGDYAIAQHVVEETIGEKTDRVPYIFMVKNKW